MQKTKFSQEYFINNAWNIDDLRKIAKSNVPSIFYDYLIGGASSESTLKSNVDDFALWELKQRVLSGITDVDLSVHLLGNTHKLPVMLGPVGFAGMYYKDGEIEASHAADKMGIPQCLSTFSICSMEDVASVRKGPLYSQLYIFKHRELTLDMLERCKKIGIDTIFITIDPPYTPVRERDERNGFRASPVPSAKMILSMLSHPFWSVGAIAHGVPKVHQVDKYEKLGSWIMEQSVKLGREIDPTLTWDDIRWFREQWKGKLVVKGILSAQDAQLAADAGADAIVVSNHGGRQLDPASSTIRRLPEIKNALGDQIEIIFDGGIRRGSDIIKAIALGANCVSLGRAYIYGLGAGGEKGVLRSIEILKNEMEPALKMMGFKSINELRDAGPEALHFLPNDLGYKISTKLILRAINNGLE
ncbi:alpha-hydroxy acid oxidase [Yersinia aldovae]|uniref:alpha-hydroxy acid oxidase n=1 Tax=Yersinia aldovae TaxID=29483 RepID=UPI0021BDEAAB|nr:alpha-hydroxy acid oxidase [Yersinia aldovae]